MNSFSMTKFIPAGRAFETDPVCEMKVDPEVRIGDSAYQQIRHAAL